MGRLTGVALVGFLFIHVSEVLNIIAIATPNWTVGNATEVGNQTKESPYSKGLWQFCNAGNCTSLNQTLQDGM